MGKKAEPRPGLLHWPLFYKGLDDALSFRNCIFCLRSVCDGFAWYNYAPKQVLDFFRGVNCFLLLGADLPACRYYQASYSVHPSNLNDLLLVGIFLT